MKKRMRYIIPAISLFFILQAYGQNTQKNSGIDHDGVRLGVSAQFYPAGFIPTVTVEPFLSEDWSLLFRAGANITDRRDFSDENITEEGNGFGGSAGIRKHFPLSTGKIVTSFITDVWSLKIDWTDNDGTPISGTTDVVVVQPYLEAGYFYPFKNTTSEVGATIGFGREINVVTNGDDVAQGFILSLALQYNFGL
ncbi:hypothetical protein [Maribacter sp. 2304DJ31-5]|uniref:hypothetical protein n=1 Tax=Maribacter sp. 2304DJ31-5 TaxID=3386273 RepID=UPI0039BC6589